MRRIGFIWIVGIFLLLFVVPVSAQEIPDFNTDSLTMDSIAIDSLDPDPEWYVAPVIPASLRAPMRTSAAAASCNRVEAIQIFDIDSVLTEGTYYEYDDRGNVISTTVWAYAPDGTMTGKSKNEYAFDAAGTQTMTAVYVWESAVNDWKGTEKYEYIYQTVAGEKKMISNTSLAWLNGAWVADHRYTYGYDEAGREISYFEYNRNTTTNELQPVLGREQGWTNDLQTLEANYTAYANGQWTAGTKKEWAFDENGTQTMFTTFTMSNGAWVGSSKETWTYGGPSAQLTLHEKYGWANNDWSKTLKEETEYAGANIIRIENYSYTNGVTTGTKKEEYSFDGGKPALTMVYAWSNGAWIGSSKEVWNYNASSKLTLHEKYGWTNNDWSLTLQEKTVYSGANITLIENYTWSNGVKTGTKKEEYTYSGSLKTSFVTYSWAGFDWVGASKEIWAYTSGKQTLHETYAWGATDWSLTLQENTAYSGANITKIENYTWSNGIKTGTQKEIWAYTSGKQTLHETYAWGTTDWSITLQENTTYSGANITKIENYTWTNGTKTGTKKEEYTYSGSLKTQEIIYAWTNDAWVETTKEVWGYTSGKLTRHETYAWGSSDWSILTQENTTYSGANIIRIENYEWVNGVKTGTQKEEYTYTSGEKTMTVVYAWANNDWVYSTKNEAGYQEGNTQVSEANYTWNGSAWVGAGTRTKTTYDGTKVIEKLTQNWPSGATDWTNAAITTNTYNADGENIMTYNGTWNGSRWVVSSMTRTDIIIDASGHQLLRASWKCAADSIWIGVQKDTAVYIADKPLYIAQYISWENGNWVPKSKSEYTYDAAYRLILLMQYDWKNGRWVNKSRNEHTFDSMGNETLNMSQKWSNNKWVGVYKYESTYNGDGKPTMQARYSWSSNSWYGITKSDYGYDAEGNLTFEISYSWLRNKWENNTKIEFLRDEFGHVVDRIVYMYEESTWVNSQRNTYAYDSRSQEISAWEYYWVQGRWSPSLQREKKYDEIDNKLRQEIDGSWNSSNGVLKSYSNNHYFYNCDPHFYTVRFVNYDGQVLANMTAQEGETPVYPGSTLTKPADTENTYTFSGWTPALAPVTANITYTATFTAIPKAYTITWKNEDGSIIKQEKLEYGTTPAHADITKESTAEYTYTFAGWTPGIGIVTGDAEYTATFTQTKNSYLITFQNEDGTVLSSDTYEYGTMPTIPTAPTKPADGANTYTFAGWDKEIVAVTEAATYTATYTTTKNSYTITFKNEDGTTISTASVEYGAMPVAPTDPTKQSIAEYKYTFSGWTPTIAEVTGDATYTATFTATKNKYLVTFKDEDGTTLKSEELEYGVMPTAPANPTKAATAEWTYTFAGWDKEIISVAEATTYTATFTATKNSYTITWKNEDGSVIESENLAYGVTPAHADINKESTAEYSYTFAGWTPQITAVTGDAEYTATFTATKRSYTITWLDEDGTEISHETLEYGVLPTHDDVTKQRTAEWTYSFIGWSPDIQSVTGDAAYTAQFNATKNSYYITWLNSDNSQLDQTLVEYGVVPTHTAPTKEATDEHSYFFAGWTPEVVAVTGEATYKATFSETTKVYTITWLNEDGSEISHETLEYGATPSHADATKENTAEYTYSFIGWSPEVTSVTGNATYTAQFNATKNSYKITWLDDDDSLIDETYVLYGIVPTHVSPTKEATDEHSYFFDKWTPDVVAVTGETTYKASYTETTKVYTITWLNEDGSEISHETLEYGATPSHVDPTKEATDEFTYTFAGWNPAVTSVTGDASYTATYTATKRSYTITWLNEDGTEISHETMEYGATPSHADINKESTAEFTYTFAGWTPAIVDVVGNASYQATFSTTKKSYTITWKNEDGSIIESETLEYGATPAHADINKESTAEYTYTFAGWTPGIGIVTGDASYTATFSATKNSYTITWLNEDGSEIEHETLEYGATPSHADVTKENTAEFTYTFTGWSPGIGIVTGDASYTATFSATKNSYTITWLNDDNTLINQTTVEYGVVPTHDDPAKQATAEFTYTFAGWDNTPIAVTGEATYKATYSAAKNSYTITWLDEDDSSLGTSTVEYGVVPTHEDPTKQPTAQYGYTFAGWSPEISAVTGNATYKATYTDTINQYTITWLDDIGTLVDQTKVAYGATPAHANIYKESDDQYDYTFVGWTPTIVPVTGDASYSAIFTTAGKSYTVTFYFEDGVTILDQMTLPYGAIPSTPYIPSIPSDANHTYTFSGWSPEIASVTGDISYVPTFTAIPNQYTVIFRNYNGKELQRKKVDYGTVPEYEGDEPSRPATNSYTWAFEGWTPELTAVIGDATYTAVYSKVINTYTILFYDEDGITLLDEVTVEHGQKPTTSVIPTKEADEEYRYTFAGWSPKIAKATSDAEYIATYLATPKTQGLNNTEAEGAAIKVIIEDKIYIRRGGNTYSIDGQRVK